LAEIRTQTLPNMDLKKKSLYVPCPTLNDGHLYQKPRNAHF